MRTKWPRWNELDEAGRLQRLLFVHGAVHFRKPGAAARLSRRYQKLLLRQLKGERT